MVKIIGGETVDAEMLLAIIAHYCDQGAPQDQQMLIALLREAQEAEGGVLSQETLQAIAQECGIRMAVLGALIRRVPGLHSQSAPHTLEICGTCPAGAKLRAFIEKAYGVKSGAACAAGFVYRVTPCMKNCKNGPSIRWDGTLHSRADEALIRKLVGNGRK